MKTKVKKGIQPSNVILSIMFIAFLFLLNNRLWIIFGNLEGQYIFHEGDGCYFLSSDTLWLKSDGSIISDDFHENATYSNEYSFLDRSLKLQSSSPSDVGSMTLAINYTIFKGIRLEVCIDSDTYYEKK